MVRFLLDVAAGDYLPWGCKRCVPKIAKLGLIGAAVLATAGTAAAEPIITTGVTGNLDDDNVEYNCTGASGVQRCLNQSRGTLVDFTSNEPLMIQVGGQARIDSEDRTFNSLTVSLADATQGFASLILNVNSAPRDSGSRFFEIDLASSDSFTSDLFELGNGQNSFTLLAPEGDLFTSVMLMSGTGANAVLFADVRQVRLGGVAEIGRGGGEEPGGGGEEPNEVPEPAALGLLGLGLVGIGIARRCQA